jgi:MFS family permease
MLSAVLPARREARWLLAGTLLSAVGRGLTLPFLFIYLTDVRGLSGAAAGLAMGWMGVVSLALSPLGGTLIDRLGARWVLLPCLALMVAGSLALAVVSSAWQAFAALTVLAVGGPTVYAGQNTILATVTSEEERQRAFGLQFTMVNLGIGIGGLIAGAIVDVHRPGTFQVVYLLDAATFLVPAAILLALPAVGVRLARSSPTAATEPGRQAATEPGRQAAAARRAAPPARVGYAEVLRHRPFRRLVIFSLVLTTCGYAQIEVGFPAFATVVAGVSPRVISWALAANAFTIVLAQLFVLRWLEGRSRARALAVVGAVFATSWLVLGGAGLVGGADAALAATGVIACAWIFSMGETLLSPVMPALTNALATDELRGRYNAMSATIWGVSGIVGPVTAGPLIGGGLADVWVVLVIGGCLAASLVALSLRPLLTPAQDGRRAPARDPVPEGMIGAHGG